MHKQPVGRLMLIVAIAALLVCGLVWWSRRPAVPGVGTIRVSRQDLTQVVNTNGKVEAIDPAVISAELNAFVTKVGATEGKLVHKGDFLLKLDTSEAEAQLARAHQTLLDSEQALRDARAGGREDERAQLEADQR